jgi:hypothetical protein
MGCDLRPPPPQTKTPKGHLHRHSAGQTAAEQHTALHSRTGAWGAICALPHHKHKHRRAICTDIAPRRQQQSRTSRYTAVRAHGVRSAPSPTTNTNTEKPSTQAKHSTTTAQNSETQTEAMQHRMLHSRTVLYHSTLQAVQDVKLRVEVAGLGCCDGPCRCMRPAAAATAGSAPKSTTDTNTEGFSYRRRLLQGARKQLRFNWPQLRRDCVMRGLSIQTISCRPGGGGGRTNSNLQKAFHAHSVCLQIAKEKL